jgi:Sec-independent protein translocase protein TatA
VNFGVDLLLLIGLGFVVLGPKHMHRMLQQAARMKAEFDQATRTVKAELKGLSQENKNHFSR